MKKLFLLLIVVAGATLAFAARYTLDIQNATQHPITNVRILGAGVDVEVGIIEPGETVSRSFFIRHDGVLMLEATGYSSRKVSGYVNRLHGERYGLVRLTDSGLSH